MRPGVRHRPRLRCSVGDWLIAILSTWTESYKQFTALNRLSGSKGMVYSRCNLDRLAKDSFSIRDSPQPDLDAVSGIGHAGVAMPSVSQHLEVSNCKCVPVFTVWVPSNKQQPHMASHEVELGRLHLQVTRPR